MSLYSEIWPLHVPIAKNIRKAETDVPALQQENIQPNVSCPHGTRRLDDPLDNDETTIEEQTEEYMPRLIRQYKQDPNLLLNQGPFERALKEMMDERERQKRAAQVAKASSQGC